MQITQIKKGVVLKTYFNSEVLEYLGDKNKQQSTPHLDRYDAARCLLILSPIEFSRFHCENKLTLSA
jgi:hypothetical protein